MPMGDPYHFDSTITVAASAVVVPLFDTLRIVILRIIKGQSLFRPDKSHIHHTIMRMGVSHSKTTSILVILQLLFILGAIALRNVGDRIMLPLVVVIAILLSLLLNRISTGRLTVKE
jgi:UDP-N-acetylmuramyl pentapeptide phosphotransferase/UDP-N-acetylglucosamine-1-phosphate transferase